MASWKKVVLLVVGLRLLGGFAAGIANRDATGYRYRTPTTVTTASTHFFQRQPTWSSGSCMEECGRDD